MHIRKIAFTHPVDSMSTLFLDTLGHIHSANDIVLLLFIDIGDYIYIFSKIPVVFI